MVKFTIESEIEEEEVKEIRIYLKKINGLVYICTMAGNFEFHIGSFQPDGSLDLYGGLSDYIGFKTDSSVRRIAVNNVNRIS